MSFFSKVIAEFCKIALNFIREGSNTNLFAPAAGMILRPLSSLSLSFEFISFILSEKLGVDVEAVAHAIEGLAYFLTESSRLLLTEIDFMDSLLVLQFDKELSEKLKDVSCLIEVFLRISYLIFHCILRYFLFIFTLGCRCTCPQDKRSATF